MQVFVEAAPVLGHSDQALQRGPRLGQRPHRAFRQMHRRQHPLLALRGIGGEQVEQGCGEFGMPDFGDGFGIAARKDIALQLRAVHQPVRRFANGLQPAQPVGQRGRHFLGARSVRGGGFGQQQPRFQKRQPCRHHQIVGGKLEPDLPGRLDEHQILVGQRQNGNLGEIDLLLPRQRQQQVERALIALDVDDQRRLVVGEFGGPSGFE